MKATLIILSFIFTANLAMARAQASYLMTGPEKFTLNEEEYVDDIPFDTYTISSTKLPDNPALQLADEEYVDDIPFNTCRIAGRVLLAEMLEDNQEPCVDDIPFNTRKICQKALLEECIAEYQDEPYVNDIPFNTRYMACCKQMMARLMPSYIDEKAAEDICFNTEEIACKYLFNRMVEDYRMEEAVSDIPFEPLDAWEYDARKDLLIYQSGATMYMRGIRSLNSIDFKMDMERYMEQFSEKIRELDQLSIDEPF